MPLCARCCLPAARSWKPTRKSTGWRGEQDRSNASDAYQRNRIRHHVIPQLQRINPNLLGTYQETQERLRATEQLLDDEVRRVAVRCRKQVGNEVWLDKTVLNQHAQLPLILFEIIRPFGFSYRQACDVARCLRTEAVTGKVFMTDRRTLLVDREYLMISERKDESFPSLQVQEGDTGVSLPGMNLAIAHHPAKTYRIDRSVQVGALDRDRLTFPLTLRPWQIGDGFYPLGMTHRKKVSDFLIDQKVPLHRKASVYVLTSDEQLVWVVGFRIDHRFRIGDQTKQVYEILVTSNPS